MKSERNKNNDNQSPQPSPKSTSKSKTLTLQPSKCSTDQFENQMGVSSASEESLEDIN